jgi:hypothetical protein
MRRRTSMSVKWTVYDGTKKTFPEDNKYYLLYGPPILDEQMVIVLFCKNIKPKDSCWVYDDSEWDYLTIGDKFVKLMKKPISLEEN